MPRDSNRVLLGFPLKPVVNALDYKIPPPSSLSYSCGSPLCLWTSIPSGEASVGYSVLPLTTRTINWLWSSDTSYAEHVHCHLIDLYIVWLHCIHDSWGMRGIWVGGPVLLLIFGRGCLPFILPFCKLFCLLIGQVGYEKIQLQPQPQFWQQHAVGSL